MINFTKQDVAFIAEMRRIGTSWSLLSSVYGIEWRYLKRMFIERMESGFNILEMKEAGIYEA